MAKRGKGHNSSTGHGAVMGLTTGKVMDCATRCKNCRICAQAKSDGKVPENHDCRKNHAGSSKSMESSVACELWNKAPLSSTKYKFTLEMMIQPHCPKCKKRYHMVLKNGLI